MKNSSDLLYMVLLFHSFVDSSYGCLKQKFLRFVTFCFVQMMQLVNQIIYGNIYSDSEEDKAEMHQQPSPSHSLREGVLLLHRGGLASFRWVKYGCVLIIAALLLYKFSILNM